MFSLEIITSITLVTINTYTFLFYDSFYSLQESEQLAKFHLKLN